ncbi:MAG: long-chain fatty acid--CoA ligase [Bacteroidales bacterium]|nr:long-chain fatty acid--CoA ligase [Candidatus Colimorpha onthohippi]
MEVTRLFDILDYRKQVWEGRDVFTYKKDGVWVGHGVDEYMTRSNQISYALLHLGLQRNECVALISSGRPEWNYIDMGTQRAGGVLLPIYPTISEDDYQYILGNSDVRFLILESESLLRKINNVLPKLPQIEHIFTINPCEQYPSIESLYQMGAEFPAAEQVAAICESIRPSDMATMIYTSGTTGQPKGVMLTHEGILSNVMGIKESPAKHWDTSLSWMPLCHIYERMMNYLYQYLGFNTYYAESVGKVADDAKEARPYIMAAVPRFIEKIYDKIYRKGEKLTGIKKRVFDWALELGFNYDVDESKLSAWFKLQRKVADLLVYKDIKKSLGGRLDMLVSGGAAIQPRLARFFSCVGLNLFEGYGLTECSPLVAVTNSDKKGRRIGSVGFPLAGLEVRINPDNNEVQCRGVNVMKGYYKSPELTAEAIDADGWFHTGDTGYFDNDGYLFLTGRTKNMFKTSMGKFVNPEVIEEKFKTSAFVLDMMVVGEGQKFAAAVVAPDFDMLKDWCKRHGVKASTREEMVADKVVVARYQKVMDKYNAMLGNTEQVKRFYLTVETWSVENKMLTPTLKIRRNVISEHYKSQIEDMFK